MRFRNENMRFERKYEIQRGNMNSRKGNRKNCNFFGLIL